MKLDKKKILILIIPVLGFLLNVFGMVTMLYIALNHLTDKGALLYTALGICLFGCALVTLGIVLFVKNERKND